MKILLVLFTGAVLTACTFGPNGICGPQTPVAYCDKDAYQRLVHPKPYIEYWEKPEMMTSKRQEDWVRCGGYPDGGFTLLTKRILPGETNEVAYARLKLDLQRCMIGNGYQYTGDCSSEYMKSQPLCGAKEF